jgi:hypothetical protein
MNELRTEYLDSLQLRPLDPRLELALANQKEATGSQRQRSSGLSPTTGRIFRFHIIESGFDQLGMGNDHLDSFLDLPRVPGLPF